MQSHNNNDWDKNYEEQLRKLAEKAERMNEEGSNTITAGAPGEEPLSKWSAARMAVTHMPPDEHEVLRLSIGGVLDGRPGPWGYLVFRGDRAECRRLLKRALRAIEAGDRVA